jgi:hypothetical protein
LVAKENAMWPEVTLLLREFARRPTIDRPERADPGLDIPTGSFISLLDRIFGPLSASKDPPGAGDYAARVC